MTPGNVAYHLTWLGVVLLAVALLSAWITRQKRREDQRRVQARRFRQALDAYAEWVLAQRLVVLFQGEGRQAAAALDEACTIRLAWFPELAADMATLLAVHNRLLAFLAAQQALWLRDPARWLASGHDQHFMALWREHRLALQVLQQRLEPLARVRRTPRTANESTYA